MFNTSKYRVWIPPATGIGTKPDFRRLEATGTFGNQLRVFPTMDDWYISGYRGWLRIANRRADSPFKKHEVAPQELVKWWHELQNQGAREEDLFLQEIPGPDNPRLLNFEVCRTPAYLYLHYGTDQKPLRDDLLAHSGQVAEGLNAVRLLRFYLEEEFEDLNEIWDRFPAAVVEGSCWNRPAGVLQKRMIVWEARQF